MLNEDQQNIKNAEMKNVIKSINISIPIVLVVILLVLSHFADSMRVMAAEPYEHMLYWTVNEQCPSGLMMWCQNSGSTCTDTGFGGSCYIDA